MEPHMEDTWQPTAWAYKSLAEVCNGLQKRNKVLEEENKVLKQGWQGIEDPAEFVKCADALLNIALVWAGPSSPEEGYPEKHETVKAYRKARGKDRQ